MRWSRVVLSILGIFLYTIPIYAQQEVKVKTGYMNMSNGIENTIPVAMAYEWHNNYIGIEGELEGFMPKIKDVNRLYALSASVIPKIYAYDLYAGFKLGYIFTAISDGMDVDDEVIRGAVVGLNLGDYFVEGQVNIADLDIETHLPYEPEIEKRSRLDNWQILVGKKYKF